MADDSSKGGYPSGLFLLFRQVNRKSGIAMLSKSSKKKAKVGKVRKKKRAVAQSKAVAAARGSGNRCVHTVQPPHKGHP